MTPVARLLALWLAAFWLPLTMHCQWVGRIKCDKTSICCQDQSGCGGGAEHCHLGICKTIEAGKFRLDNDSVQVPVGSLARIVPFGVAEFRQLLILDRSLSEATGAPPGLHRRWQFVFRAALAPRAPSAAC